MLNMTLIKGDDDSNNDDNNKPARAVQFNVLETAFTEPDFRRSFVIVESSVQRQGHQHKVRAVKKIK